MTEEISRYPSADQHSTSVLLVLNVPLVLEEPVTDFLLSYEGEARPGFTTMRVGGHSSQPGALSAAEQVSGRRRRVQFQVLLSAEDGNRMIDSLAQCFAEADLHYWLVPVLRSGRLRSD